MLTNLITGKLNAIAQSFHEGTASRRNSRTSSPCREAIDTMFSEGVDEAFREAVIYQDYGLIVPIHMKRTSRCRLQRGYQQPSWQGQRSARRRLRDCTLISMR